MTLKKEGLERDHDLSNDTSTRYYNSGGMDHRSNENRTYHMLPCIECILLQNRMMYQRRSRVLRYHPYARPLRVRCIALFWVVPLITQQHVEEEERVNVLLDVVSCERLTYRY